MQIKELRKALASGMTQEPGLLKSIDNFMRGAANGMTFGAADYIAGVADRFIYDSTGTLYGNKELTLAENVYKQSKLSRQAMHTDPGYMIGAVLGGATPGIAMGIANGASAIGLGNIGALSAAASGIVQSVSDGPANLALSLDEIASSTLIGTKSTQPGMRMPVIRR